MDIKNKVENILKDLNVKSPEIEASSVVTGDGIVVASVMKPEIQPERIAAMCSALLGLADTAAKELEKGELRLVLLHGENGVLLLVHIGTTHVLAVSASAEIKLGAVLVEAKRTASSILALLKGS